jgi:hypothetical protein
LAYFAHFSAVEAEQVGDDERRECDDGLDHGGVPHAEDWQAVLSQQIYHSVGVAGAVGELAGQQIGGRFVQSPAHPRGGARLGNLVVDELAQFEWEQHWVPVDSEEAGVVLVEPVRGDFDDLAEGQDVEPDQTTDDAYLAGQRGVVQAAAQLLVVLIGRLEVHGERAFPFGQFERAGQVPAVAQRMKEHDVLGRVAGEPEVEVLLVQAVATTLSQATPVRTERV